MIRPLILPAIMAVGVLCLAGIAQANDPKNEKTEPRFVMVNMCPEEPERTYGFGGCWAPNMYAQSFPDYQSGLKVAKADAWKWDGAMLIDMKTGQRLRVNVQAVGEVLR